MTVVCAEVVAPDGALQLSVNCVVVASASVDVEPLIPVAIAMSPGAKSPQLEVLTLDQMSCDFRPFKTAIGSATSVAKGFAGVDVAVGGVTGGLIGVTGVGAGELVPKSLPSS